MLSTITQELDGVARVPVTRDGHLATTVRRTSRSGLTLAFAAALLVGTLTATVAVALPGASGAATATPVNTMYVVNLQGSSISSFAPGATGNAAPLSTVSGAGSTLNGPYHMAMDHAGNIWVVNTSANTVVEYTQAQLATGGAQAPTITLTSTANSLDTPFYLTFDRSGDLWVGNNGPGTGSVVEFTPGQLLTSGAPTPQVTITSNASNSLDLPGALVFDGQGDLWIANATNGTIVKLTPAQLSTTGSPNPSVTLTTTGGSISASAGLAFDRSGNLWVGSTSGPKGIVAFSPAQLAVSGSPVPSVILSSNGTNLDEPAGLTFDNFGNLWVGNYAGNSVTEFSPAQLTSSGTPTPIATLTGGLTGLSGPTNVLFVPATGYTMAASDGGIFNYGGSGYFGSHGGSPLNKPIVGMTGSPDGLGYWLVASDGGIFNYGDAGFYGSHGGSPLNQPIVGMAATPDGKGYWMAASDGGVFTYGDATFYGSHGGSPLNKPIVGMAATPDGKGYWLVASDGGIFSYGDATFSGSHGGSPLNKPIVGMATTQDGGGYWLVASDGGIFTYGDASFYGSAGSITLNKPIVGMAVTPDGGGYWLVATDGGIFNYGNAGFLGSHGGSPLNKPIVAMSGPYG